MTSKTMTNKSRLFLITGATGNTGARLTVDLLRNDPCVRVILLVIHLADSCYIGQAHTFLGAYYASLPLVLGKDMNLAKSYLEKGVSINQGNFLPARLAYARYFQLLSGDQNGYRIVLQAIIDAPQSENQSQALDNAVAKELAKKLLVRFEDG